MHELTLPFFYVVEGRPYRAKTSCRSTVMTFRPFAIPTATRDEAPVAVTWSFLSDDGARRSDYLSRCFEGKLYTPIRADGQEPVDAKSFEEALQVLRDVSRPKMQFSFLTASLPRLPFLRSTSDRCVRTTRDQALWDVRGLRREPARNVSDDEVLRTETAARAYQETLLIIDGALWTTVGAEPSWRVTDDPTDAQVNLTLSAALVSYDELPFRADEGTKALRVAARWAAAGRRELVQTTCHVEILMPDALREGPTLLCEGLLDALRGYDSYRATQEGVPFEPWGSCSHSTGRLGNELLALSRGIVRDADTAAATFDTARDILRMVEREAPCEGYLREQLPHRIRKALELRSERERCDEVERDESDDDVLRALAI